MPFLWVWLAGTADPILVEDTRSGGCSGRGYLRLLGPWMGLSSQVCRCLPPSMCPRLDTAHSACGYKAQQCSGELQTWGKPEEHSMETNHPDGPARAPERSMSWSGGCGSLPAQWDWIRLQQGRSSLLNCSTPVLLCEGKVLDSHCLPRDCRPLDPAYTWPRLTVCLSRVIWDSSPIIMLSFHPSAFPPALNMLCMGRVLHLDRQVQLSLCSAEFTNASYLIHLLFSLRYWEIFFYFLLSHIRENKVKLCAAVAGAWPVRRQGLDKHCIFCCFSRRQCRIFYIHKAVVWSDHTQF